MFARALATSLLVMATAVAPPQAAQAQVSPPLAPVEARVPFAPAVFVGGDGLRHLAYELHVTNFYLDTGPLVPRGLSVLADADPAPLLVLDGKALAAVTKPSGEQGGALSIAPGRRAVVFVWITLRPGAAVPQVLHHRVEFALADGAVTVLEGARIPVDPSPVPSLAAPLRGGRWLAHEGPGAAQSHHWGSLVAVNGELTIPQRYALDLVGVDTDGHVIRAGRQGTGQSVHADWVGYGADVLAVADGVVVGVRDGQPEHPPLSPQPEPGSLTADGLFGNYVVLEIAPSVFASYAHLQRGSVQARPGQRVHRGQVLARLGQSGNSAAPHLHFQVTNAATFQGSEGIPYVFDRFQLLGTETEAQLFGQGEPWRPGTPMPRQRQLPLNDTVVVFPGPSR